MKTRRWLTALLAAAAVIAAPSALFAHVKLASSEPAAGQKLEQPPSRIRLVFTEKPELAFSSIRLVTPTGDTVQLAGIIVDPDNRNALIGETPGASESGNYQVIWRTAARDGHASHGVLTFSVAPPALFQPSDSSAVADDHDNAAMSIGGAVGAIIARWLSFISIFGVIGVVGFRMLILRKMSPKGGDLFSQLASTNAAMFGIVTGVGALVGGLLKLNREARDMPDVSIGSMLFDSAWGLSLMLQLLGALVAIVAFYRAHQRPNKNAWFAAMIASLALAVSPSLSSHASTTPQPVISVIADIVHVTSGSLWLGTLAVIMVVGISAALKTPDSVRPGARLASMINVFSPVALTCGGAIVFTGVIASVYHLKPLRSLWTTPYGVALLFKLFFVALLFAAGAWNWRRMKPRLTGDDAVSPMRSSATLELLLATVVLGMTAILVALEVP